MNAILSLFLYAVTTIAAPQDDAVRELTAVADAWDKAIVRKDQPAIEANMAPDFLQIRGNGKLVGREDFIRGIMDPTLTLDPYVVEDFSVRLLGDAVALLYGRIRMKGSSSGERFEDHFRYIDTYAKRGGRWQVVSVQITLMATAQEQQPAP
jgi:ketosteroid isomerase-like protein